MGPRETHALQHLSSVLNSSFIADMSEAELLASTYDSLHTRIYVEKSEDSLEEGLMLRRALDHARNFALAPCKRESIALRQHILTAERIARETQDVTKAKALEMLRATLDLNRTLRPVTWKTRLTVAIDFLSTTNPRTERESREIEIACRFAADLIELGSLDAA